MNHKPISYDEILEIEWIIDRSYPGQDSGSGMMPEELDALPDDMASKRRVPWKYSQDGHPVEILNGNRSERRAEAKAQRRKR